MVDGSAPKRSQSWRGSTEVLSTALAPYVDGPSWLKYGEARWMRAMRGLQQH